MWFKRSPDPRPDPQSSHQFALRPWGDEAYLSPHHLPLRVEGDAGALHLALLGLLAAAREQQIPVFVQEGQRPLLAGWADLKLPARQTLPPLAPGATRETIRQTLSEVLDWLNKREPSGQPWPALLLGSSLGPHQDTVLKVLRALNQRSEAQLGLIYVQRTSSPPPERPEFAAQLYCQPGGRAQLRRHQGYHSFQLPAGPPASYTPAKVIRPSTHSTLG